MSIPQILIPIETSPRSYSTLLSIYVSPGSAAAVRAAVVAIKRHGLDSIDGNLSNMRNGYECIGDLIMDIRSDALDAADPEQAVKDDPRYGSDVLETIWGDDSILKALLSRLPIPMLLEFRMACNKVRGMLDTVDSAQGILLPVYRSVFKKLLRDPPEIPDPFALTLEDLIRLRYHHAATIIVDGYGISARDAAGDSVREAVSRGCASSKASLKLREAVKKASTVTSLLTPLYLRRLTGLAQLKSWLFRTSACVLYHTSTRFLSATKYT
jgi:hypothetical protein